MCNNEGDFSKPDCCKFSEVWKSLFSPSQHQGPSQLSIKLVLSNETCSKVIKTNLPNISTHQVATYFINKLRSCWSVGLPARQAVNYSKYANLGHISQQNKPALWSSCTPPSQLISNLNDFTCDTGVFLFTTCFPSYLFPWLWQSHTAFTLSNRLADLMMRWLA